MAEPFLGEIRMFAGNFIPRNWAFCNGGEMSINQNSALFSLLGITYGGNGTSTFGLPDLSGRAAVGSGQAPGLSSYPLGLKIGTENVTLSAAEMPTHTHTVSKDEIDLEVTVANDSGDEHTPTAGTHISKSYAGAFQVDTEWFTESDQNLVKLGGVVGSGSVVTEDTGLSKPHYNVQPSLAVYYIIALEGLYPSRS